MCNYVSPVTQEPQKDTFTKSISFEANPISTVTGSTSAGNPLKKLRNMICPYFGTPLINGKQLNMAERAIDKCKNIREVVNVLSNYKQYMQPVEKEMYHKFVTFAQKTPKIQLQECLQTLYDNAILKLKLEEFNVLDDIDKISLKMSPENAIKVHSKTTRCRQVILTNNQEDTFKRKTLLESLNEIKPRHREYEAYNELKDRAEYLPTSGTSTNAFIVKYANRSQQEIAKRLIRPSLASIEHIKPHSNGGKDSLSNFMLASSGANSRRSSIPLPKFIKMYPNIPKNCQKYINQIIEKIHNKEFQGKETYPYKLQKALFEESKGIINLDLSNYKYTKKEAQERVKMYYKNQRTKRG